MSPWMCEHERHRELRSLSSSYHELSLKIVSVSYSPLCLQVDHRQDTVMRWHKSNNRIC